MPTFYVARPVERFPYKKFLGEMRQQPCRIKVKGGGGQEKVVLYIALSGCKGEGWMMDFTDVLMVGG